MPQYSVAQFVALVVNLDNHIDLGRVIGFCAHYRIVKVGIELLTECGDLLHPESRYYVEYVLVNHFYALGDFLVRYRLDRLFENVKLRY